MKLFVYLKNNMIHKDHKMSYPKDKKSKRFVSRKIRKLMKEGKKQSQAVAIALSMAREKKHG